MARRPVAKLLGLGSTASWAARWGAERDSHVPGLPWYRGEEGRSGSWCASLTGWSRCESWENDRTMIGKWWENDRKMMGHVWENDRKMIGRWWLHGGWCCFYDGVMGYTLWQTFTVSKSYVKLAEGRYIEHDWTIARGFTRQHSQNWGSPCSWFDDDE